MLICNHVILNSILPIEGILRIDSQSSFVVGGDDWECHFATRPINYCDAVAVITQLYLIGSSSSTLYTMSFRHNSYCNDYTNSVIYDLTISVPVSKTISWVSQYLCQRCQRTEPVVQLLVCSGLPDHIRSQVIELSKISVIEQTPRYTRFKCNLPLMSTKLKGRSAHSSSKNSQKCSMESLRQRAMDEYSLHAHLQ